MQEMLVGTSSIDPVQTLRSLGQAVADMLPLQGGMVATVDAQVDEQTHMYVYDGLLH
jgi:hypothetical protein